ncbi:MAG: terpene cyclase/mutase family protein, partial [Lacipirellulaceae bacterium]
RPSHTATYNHAIAGVMLSEAYGMNPERRDERLRSAIERAIARTRQLQTKRKPRPQDVGGWRYIRRSTEGADFESDLSVTAWHLMFYRSALNAGFEVRQEFAEEAVAYVRRCHVPLGDRNRRRGAFSYFAEGTHMANHPMTGCGLLTLALGGAADDPLCQDAADWLLAHPSRRYDDLERFSYAAYYSSQAMAQMGGHYWKEYYPSLAMGIVRGQQRDGSWLSQHDTTADFGPCYPTSMSILALTTGYQLLPIYQR